MSIALPVSLYSGEQILKEGACTHLRSTPTNMGFNLAIGYAWLTNARLIMSPQQQLHAGPVRVTFGPVAYPIGHIVGVETTPVKVGFSKKPVLRLEFDNGGKEFFDFGREVEDWQQAVMQAQQTAPVVPYDSVPVLKSGVEGAAAGVRKMFLLIFGTIAACGTLTCIVGLIVSALQGR
jgi:hypothetical protein